MDDIKKSEPLVETLNAKNAILDPLNLDKDDAKFVNNNLPQVSKQRRLNYYMLADPELRPNQPTTSLRSIKSAKTKKKGVSRPYSSGNRNPNNYDLELLRRQEIHNQALKNLQVVIAETMEDS